MLRKIVRPEPKRKKEIIFPCIASDKDNGKIYILVKDNDNDIRVMSLEDADFVPKPIMTLCGDGCYNLDAFKSIHPNCKFYDFDIVIHEEELD